MRRREFIALLGGGAVAWPMMARAQQPAMPVVGFLQPGSPAESGHFAAAFLKGLKDAGYVEGDSLRVEYRWAEGQYERFPQFAEDLVKHNVRGPRQTQCKGHRRRWPARDSCRQVGHTDHPDRLHHRRRPGQGRPGRELQPPRRQSDRRDRVRHRFDVGQAARIAARIATRRRRRGHSGQSAGTFQPRHERHDLSGTKARNSTLTPERGYGRRYRGGVCHGGRATDRGTVRQ